MLKKAFKRILSISCVAALLIMTPGITLLANDLEESSSVSSVEGIIQDAADEETTIENDGFVEDLEDLAEDKAADGIEATIGAGSWTVGDGVTATFDSETGTLEFFSDNGTLSKDWATMMRLDKTEISSIRVRSGIVYLPANCNNMFSLCYNLTNLDLSNFDTSNVTDMWYMFYQCHSLINLDLSSFETSNVTDMGGMFCGCHSLTKLDLSSFNTSNVTNVENMFLGCLKLENLDLRSFDTSNMTDMERMFYNCRNLENLDLRGFNTLNLGDMRSMFYGCEKLTNLDLSSFNTSDVDDMWGMFMNCHSLTNLDLSGFDTSNVTDMGYMFNQCHSLTNLDLSNFNTSNVTDMAGMFEGCICLTDLELSSFDMSHVTHMPSMFLGCSNLVNLNTPKLNLAEIDLPITMYDKYGIAYNSLSCVRTENSKSILLTKEKPIGTIDISDCTIILSEDSYPYDGNAKEPSIKVKYEQIELRPGVDYTVDYINNTNPGSATVKVIGQETYKGSKTAVFTISKVDPTLNFITLRISKTSLDTPFTNTLNQITDGSVSFYSGNTSVAIVNSISGEVTIKGIGTTEIIATATEGKNYNSGNASYTLIVTPVSLENAFVGGVSLSYGYSGKAYTPTVTVKVDGKTLTKETDYTVQYENNVKPGTAKITVTGKGNYTGTKTKTFEIVNCASSIVSGKTYQLIPKNNSKTAVCAIGGRMVNNTKVYITDRGNSESQKFKAVKNSDGTWKLINAKCELALAVQQNSSSLGAGLVLYDQTTRPAQNWKLSKKADNSFAIINSVTGYSIAMSDKSAVKGTTLSMAETASVGQQRFYLVETSAVSAPFDGTKSIRAAKNKNFSVNIASASKAEGANVSLYTYTNSNARKFKIIYSGGGYYRLVNVNSGLCLTIKDNSNADGANIIQSKWKGYSSQRWKITKNSDGTVTITNMLGTVLHLLGNRTVNNTNIHARKAATTTAQKWYLN